MPHPRKRLITNKVLKKLSFFPILAIQGARQTGKSFLVKKLLKEKLKSSRYVSFDNESDQAEAERSPRSFLVQYEDFKPLIIDEAQKVPKIFDALKFEVDEDRKPSKFLILGSTEFSLMNQIRESLTGRMGRIRIFPLTLLETIQEQGFVKVNITHKGVLRYLKSGGMPGFFSVHEEENRIQLIQDWLNLVCFRDLHQFKKLKLSSELALKLLSLICTEEEPTFSNLVKKTKVDGRKVKTHLKALQELFVIYRLDPHPSSFGKKSLYFVLDPGIADYLGATIERKLHIALLNERFTKHSIDTSKPIFFYYYRSSGKNIIHLVEEETGKPLRCYHLLENEKIDIKKLAIVKAFEQKNPHTQAHIYAPIINALKVDGHKIQLWEDLFSLQLS